MLSQSEILAVPEVDYCGNGGSLSELDPSCVTFYNNLKAATDKADSILRTLLGGGAYSQLKTYKLYDRETYQQYGYTIPMGFPAIETKVLFLRPGEVAKDAEGNLVNHTNREPGQKVTSSTQCLNRTTGWPSPLCGNQKMQDIMRDKPFIVSAQVNESYSIPFLGKQTYPAIGTQVFYAAGSEVIEEIQKIATSTPTATPTRTVTPRQPAVSTNTPTPTPTPTRTPLPLDANDGLENYNSGGEPSACRYFQNWTGSYTKTETYTATCEKVDCVYEWVCKTEEVCKEGSVTWICTSRDPETTCTPTESGCLCCDQGFWYDCGKGLQCWAPPFCSQSSGIRTCQLEERKLCKSMDVQTCTTTTYPCQKEKFETFDLPYCTEAGSSPMPEYGVGITLMQMSPIGNPYLACYCGGGPCNTWCTGGTGIAGCRGDYDCIYNPCWNPATGRSPSCSLNVNARCASQCG